MNILGIWDGHDAGAALVRGSTVLAAMNEERFTRRKLEVGFPRRSIEAVLAESGLSHDDVGAVAFSTSDFSKTVSRIFPFLKEGYYQARRRKRMPRWPELQKRLKFLITTWGTVAITEHLSRALVRRELEALGFRRFRLHCVDHHRCHALAAALLAPFDESITVTLDGLGDGLSGTISRFSKGKQEVLSLLPAADSLGIFFEQVTYLLNMRELEDEGKVMALADYAPPLKPQDNPLRDFFRVEGLDVRCRHTPGGMLEALRRVHWRTSAEEFARMAQDTLEEHACALVRNALESAPCLPLCFAGGVASNIRLNLRLRHCAGDRGWFVFPHMGDGGLALGAALHANLVERGIARYEWEDVSWGSSFSEEEILKEVSSRGLPHRRVRDAARIAASYIAQGEIVFWFQGRMEYGPRALGNRSILAPAGSRDARDRLNLLLKRRNWFQPFCPSMMTEEAERLIEDYDGFPARFMTMGYKVRPEWRERLAAVVSVEGSMRPQMVDPGPGRYRALLEEVKRLTGAGIILNTSFNRHGEPLVRTPAEALDTFTRVGGKHMVMEDILVACSAEDLKDPGEPAEYCVSGKGG